MDLQSFLAIIAIKLVKIKVSELQASSDLLITSEYPKPCRLRALGKSLIVFTAEISNFCIKNEEFTRNTHLLRNRL